MSPSGLPWGNGFLRRFLFCLCAIYLAFGTILRSLLWRRSLGECIGRASEALFLRVSVSRAFFFWFVRWLAAEILPMGVVSRRGCYFRTKSLCPCPANSTGDAAVGKTSNILGGRGCGCRRPRLGYTTVGGSLLQLSFRVRFLEPVANTEEFSRRYRCARSSHYSEVLGRSKSACIE